MEATQMKDTRKHRGHKRNWATCEQCGKRRYRDRKSAKLALREAQFARATAELNGQKCTWTVRREYLCDACGGWHLTSQVDTYRTAACRDSYAGGSTIYAATNAGGLSMATIT